MTLITADEYNCHCSYCYAKTEHNHEQHNESVADNIWHDARMADHLGVPDASEARQ